MRKPTAPTLGLSMICFDEAIGEPFAADERAGGQHPVSPNAETIAGVYFSLPLVDDEPRTLRLARPVVRELPARRRRVAG